MKRYALIGHRSDIRSPPEIHRRLFALEGLDADYALLDIPPEELAFPGGYPAGTRRLQRDDPPQARRHPPARLPRRCRAPLWRGQRPCLMRTAAWSVTTPTVAAFCAPWAAHGVAIAGDICVLGAGGVGGCSPSNARGRARG